MERRQNEKWDQPKAAAPKDTGRAKQKPNFSGEFALNLNTSKLEGGAASARDAVLRIDHHEPMIRIEAKFVFFDKTFAWSMHRQCDGRETTDPSDPRATSSLSWDNDTLLFVYRAEVTTLWRYELEDSGRRLKATERIRGGAGLSGLAAAVFFEKDKGGSCLVIDNHPIFGGEAKRNEFRVNGQTLIAHQGSAIFLVPGKGGYTDRFYQMIGMDRSTFEYQKWSGSKLEMPLAQSPYDIGSPKQYGFYFGSRFGKHPGVWLIDPWGKQLAGAPIREMTKLDLLRYRTVRDDSPRPQTEGDAISRQLDTITIEDHLMRTRGISRETIREFLSPIEGGGYGLGPDALSAYCNYAIETEFPEDGDDKLGDQMFPDGNTGFARLMVKTLIPDAIAGPRTVDATWQNRVNFRALDRASQPTRIRLNSTVVRVEHAGTPSTASHVVITYAKGGRLYRLRARSVIMANGSWTTKHVVSDLPASHRE